MLEAAPQQEAQPNYVVSLMVVKEIPTGVNTQNKLYTVNAASADEAVDKAVLQMPSDFPEHLLHTACFVAIPAQPSPAPLSESIDQLERALAIIGVVGAIDGHDVVRRESVLEIARRAALAAQRGNK